MASTHGHPLGPHGHMKPRDYSQTPLNVYWEVTRACDLACRHCRASAMSTADPEELTFDEGRRLLQQIREFGDPSPQLILTGGDPLKRSDLYDLMDEARTLGIEVSITPAATGALTREVLIKLQTHGASGLGLSLDGSSAERHDSIRGVPGTFDRTMEAIRFAGELKFPLQVNTLVSEETAQDLPAVYELLKQQPLARWSLFFLISVGRGKVLQPLSPERAEELMNWVYDTSAIAPFTVATTEAPSYRRIALDRMRAEGMTGEAIKRSPAQRSFGIRDGHGVVFVSHMGEICPAGFLPVAAGNVRTESLAQVYRHSSLFQALHDPSHWEDRCGLCEYHAICGGSRARAFSATNDPLAADPLCLYQPRAAGKVSH